MKNKNKTTDTKVLAMKHKINTNLKVIDVSGMNAKQIRALLDQCNAKLKELENKEYYEKVIQKYKDKYEGKWVKLHGSDRYSYEGDTGYRLVKIREVKNVYHQDDAVKYEIEVSIDCNIRLNMPKQSGYTAIDISENGKHICSMERMTISEKNENPKILDEIQLQEIREEARLCLLEKLNLLG